MSRHQLLRFALAMVAAGGAGCTEVGTDPDAIVAIRFGGSAYPSIVAGDTLRDSLGLVQPLQVAPLNFRGDSVPGADVGFSSPDTIVRVTNDGVVFARGPKADATPVRVFATVGTLQSQPDSLFVVSRADSIAPATGPLTRPAGATVVPDTISFNVYVPAATAGAAASPAPFWLVSFQLLFHGELLPPADTSAAYTFSGPPLRPVRSFIDTTSATGSVSRGLVVQCSALAIGPDSVVVIATIRDRRPGNEPKSARTVVRFERTTCQ
jgi:hypothetical protein